MKQINRKILIFSILLLIVLDFVVFLGFQEVKNTNCVLKYHIVANEPMTLETYFSDSEVIDSNNKATVVMNNTDGKENFTFPWDSTRFLRIDLGEVASDIELSQIYFIINDSEIEIPIDQFEQMIKETQGIVEEFIDGEKLIIKTEGNDPYILLDIQNLQIKENMQAQYEKKIVREKIMVCVIVDLLIVLVALFVPSIYEIIFRIIKNIGLLFRLAINDFKTRYVGSYFGIFWAIVQPLITVLMYWFVFQVGLGAGPVNGHPFVIWLIAGLIPWMFFQDAVLYGTNALLEYSYLVKKVVFEVDILPMVKIISALFIHLIFLAISSLLFIFMGYFPGIFFLQIIYYSVCAGVLAIALSYFTSSIVLFFRDLAQIVNIMLQIGTWMTPILWQVSVVPEYLRWFFKLNPMYYVVQGYRDTILDKILFVNRLGETAYFWGVVVVLFALGTTVYRRLEPHFADML